MELDRINTFDAWIVHAVCKIITFDAWIVHRVRYDFHFCCLDSSWS